MCGTVGWAPINVKIDEMRLSWGCGGGCCVCCGSTGGVWSYFALRLRGLGIVSSESSASSPDSRSSVYRLCIASAIER